MSYYPFTVLNKSHGKTKIKKDFYPALMLSVWPKPERFPNGHVLNSFLEKKWTSHSQSAQSLLKKWPLSHWRWLKHCCFYTFDDDSFLEFFISSRFRFSLNICLMCILFYTIDFGWQWSYVSQRYKLYQAVAKQYLLGWIHY